MSTFAEDAPRKLFVVGVGRSGTSLLQSMLGSHTGIAFLPETGFVRRHLLGEAARAAPASGSPTAFLDALGPEDRSSRWPIEPDRLRGLAEAGRAEAEARGWTPARCVYEAVSRACAAGARFAGDKDPRNVEHLEGLAALWPDCRVVHVVRDPRDVLLSRKKAAWSRDHGLFRQLAACAVQFRLGARAAPRLGDERLRALHYERLLADPAGELDGLCRWLGLEFEPAMLEFAPTASALVAPDELAWKSTTLGPLLAGNTRKWVAGLTPFEIGATEGACAEAMAHGDYPRADAAALRAATPEGRSASPGGVGPALLAGRACGRLVRALARLYTLRRRAPGVPPAASEPGPVAR